MKTTGNQVVTAMLDAWRAVPPIRRASIRWRCDVRLYRRGRAVVISHRPTVLIRSVQ
jgi:hypothetical protein